MSIQPSTMKRTNGRVWGSIAATKGGVTTQIMLHESTNSLGEPDVFAAERPGNGKKEFAGLRGWPLYAIQTWLVGHGYTYEVE